MIKEVVEQGRGCAQQEKIVEWGFTPNISYLVFQVFISDVENSSGLLGFQYIWGAKVSLLDFGGMALNGPHGSASDH